MNDNTSSDLEVKRRRVMIGLIFLEIIALALSLIVGSTTSSKAEIIVRDTNTIGRDSND